MAPNLQAFTKLKWYMQIAVVAGVCGAGLGGFWYWMLSPMETQITEKEGQLTTLQQEVAASLLLKKKFEQFKAETNELGKRLEELKAVLPLERETDIIMRSIQAEGKASGVKINLYQLRGLIDHEVYTEWPWNMEVVGTYNSVCEFFDRMRRLPRIVNVTNLRMSGRASEGAASFTASVGVTFTATTFIYHEEPIASSAPPAKPAK